MFQLPLTFLDCLEIFQSEHVVCSRVRPTLSDFLLHNATYENKAPRTSSHVSFDSVTLYTAPKPNSTCNLAVTNGPSSYYVWPG